MIVLCAWLTTYYEGILKMEGASGLPLAKTFERKFATTSIVAAEISVPPAEAAADGSAAAVEEDAAAEVAPDEAAAAEEAPDGGEAQAAAPAGGSRTWKGKKWETK